MELILSDTILKQIISAVGLILHNSDGLLDPENMGVATKIFFRYRKAKLHWGVNLPPPVCANVREKPCV